MPTRLRSRPRPNAAARRGHTETRVFDVHGLELREADDGTLTLTGHAAVFDSPSEGLPWRERIMPGAFTRTLAGSPDVRLLFNHNADTVMARTNAGTLSLAEDDVGLSFEASLDPDDFDVARLAPKVRKGHITQMSFAFWIAEGGEEWVTVDGERERHLTELDIDGGDISSVTYPAYPATDLQLRSLDLERGRAAVLEAFARSDPTSMRAIESYNERYTGLETALDEYFTGAEGWHWICDFGDDWVVYEEYGSRATNPGFWRLAYEVGSNDLITFTSDPVQVLRRVVWEPVEASDDDTGNGDDTGDRGAGDTPPTMSIELARKVRDANARRMQP